MSPASPPPPSRADRLKLLNDEPKHFLHHAISGRLTELIETMSLHQERYFTKNGVLDEFRPLLKDLRKVTDVDKEAICVWLERILEIQGLESSEGLLERWLHDLPL